MHNPVGEIRNAAVDIYGLYFILITVHQLYYIIAFFNIEMVIVWDASCLLLTSCLVHQSVVTVIFQEGRKCKNKIPTENSVLKTDVFQKVIAQNK